MKLNYIHMRNLNMRDLKDRLNETHMLSWNKKRRQGAGSSKGNKAIHRRVNEESKMKHPTDIMLCTNRQEEQIKITVRKNLHPSMGKM